MSKVDIRRLDSVTANDTTATALINENFEKLQAGIEDALSRTGKTPNFMDADFDMNSRRIINCGEAVEDNDVVTYKVVKDAISTAKDSATSAANSAAQAATSAQSALVSSTNAINALRNAEDTLTLASGLLTETQQYVDEAKEDINTTVVNAKQEINTTVDDAQMNLSDTIQQAVEDVKREAVEAAEGAINDAAATATSIVVEYANNEIKPELVGYKNEAETSATSASASAILSRTWATGTDDEVQAIEKDEHSSRTYANFSMALANAPEDVPVLESTLLATDVVKGPKGDSGEADFSGDVSFTGTFDVHSDSNHPIKVTGMAGTSATGYQIVDSNGLGDSDFEHYATGDRYGTKITNHNNTSNTSVSIDMYQSNVGKSVIDFSEFDTMFAPALLKTLYPVGSIYITTNSTCPMETLGVGTWELVAADRVLQGAGSRGVVGSTLEESLPNITGYLGTAMKITATTGGGVFAGSNDFASTSKAGSSSGINQGTISFDASNSSAVYQNNAPVQPAAYLVNIFRRIS